MNKLKFVDLFAGIGGIRLPFDELGYDCVFSSEWDKKACETYKANFGEIPSGDITMINEKEIPSFDLCLAGFPYWFGFTRSPKIHMATSWLTIHNTYRNPNSSGKV